MPRALPPLSYVFMAQCLIKYTYNWTVLRMTFFVWGLDTAAILIYVSR
jgi:hypothetical protein